MPRITIGLSCFNSANTVLDAVRSVFAQTLQDWELIVVDDGSTDDTPAVLERLEHERVRWIADGAHCGLPARLNQIANLAKGELLARMDADDIMMPERLEQQSFYLDANPECTLVGSAIVCMDGDARPLRIRTAPPNVDSSLDVFRGTPVFHPTVLGRTEWFRKHPYDESCDVSQDLDLWARNADNLLIQNIQEALLFYREYDDYTWSKYRRQSRATRRILRREGPAKIGQTWTRRLLAARTAKDAAYAFLAAIGCWRFALNQRNQSITPQDAERYRRIILTIQRQQLPGFKERAQEQDN